jgi:ABC-type lipoprotein release transport system permease subunit
MIPSAGRLEEYKNMISATIDTSKYELMTWKEMMPELNQFIEVDSAGNYITIIILYLVISFGLFGTILMMTKERMHEFGILVAIGMKKRILTFIVVAEMILMSITGAAAGIVASIPVVWYFKLNPIRFTGQLEQVYIEFGMEPIIPFSSDPGIFITQGVIVFCLAVILGLYPFIKIVNLRPVQAINS